MIILSIDTSCDETSVAITNGRRILANAIYSQILIHKKWGGVVPYLAKRAHEERIDMVVDEAIKKACKLDQNLLVSKLTSPKGRPLVSRATSQMRGLRRDSLAQTTTHGVNLINAFWKSLDYIAVTHGPGLAPALEVGIKKAQELAKKYNKKIIPVNHMEGHIYSVFAQNSMGNPDFDYHFPYLALLVSGGHTELVLLKDHVTYEILGETLDDAAGEALDKAAKMLSLGYPGGPVIEQLAKYGDTSYHKFPRPYIHVDNLNFSFSGLKTSFFYFLKKNSNEEIQKNIANLATTFQDAVFTTLCLKLEKAILQTGVTRVIGAGGVMINANLRQRIRKLVKKYDGTVLFPREKYLYGDNAAMIGIAAHYNVKKATNNNFERVPRSRLGDKVTLLPMQHQ